VISTTDSDADDLERIHKEVRGVNPPSDCCYWTQGCCCTVRTQCLVAAGLSTVSGSSKGQHSVPVVSKHSDSRIQGLLGAEAFRCSLVHYCIAVGCMPASSSSSNSKREERAELRQLINAGMSCHSHAGNDDDLQLDLQIPCPASVTEILSPRRAAVPCAAADPVPV
jgi:hypothetical protein